MIAFDFLMDWTSVQLYLLHSFNLTLSRELISAPWPSSRATISSWPLYADRWSPVLPRLSLMWMREVDLLSKRLTTAVWPFCAARWSGVEPCREVTASAWTPGELSRTRTKPSWPDCAARWRGVSPCWKQRDVCIYLELIKRMYSG